MMALRFLDGDEDGDTSNSLFNVAIATIFAREVLEGAIIIGQYRTVIQKSLHFDDEFKAKALKTVTRSTIFATACSHSCRDRRCHSSWCLVARFG